LRPHVFVGPALGTVLVLGASFWVRGQIDAAADRLANPQKAPETAIASHAEAAYCTPEFKIVLQRVLNACGLVGTGSRRGCKPADVKNIASISDADFNALFLPLKERGGIVMFDEGKDNLDAGANQMIEDRWLDRQGARYFFIVARGSKTGTIERNRVVSHKRGNPRIPTSKNRWECSGSEKNLPNFPKNSVSGNGREKASATKKPSTGALSFHGSIAGYSAASAGGYRVGLL